MNKSMMIGVVASVAVATAGGVAAYSYMGKGIKSYHALP